MIPKKTFNNLTILQKLKEDNSIRLFKKKEQPNIDFQYRAPYSVPLSISLFCLDKSSLASDLKGKSSLASDLKGKSSGL